MSANLHSLDAFSDHLIEYVWPIVVVQSDAEIACSFSSASWTSRPFHKDQVFLRYVVPNGGVLVEPPDLFYVVSFSAWIREDIKVFGSNCL